MIHTCDDCLNRQDHAAGDYCKHDYRPCREDRICRNGWHTSPAWRDEMLAMLRGEA